MLLSLLSISSCNPKLIVSCIRNQGDPWVIGKSLKKTFWQIDDYRLSPIELRRIIDGFWNCWLLNFRGNTSTQQCVNTSTQLTVSERVERDLVNRSGRFFVATPNDRFGRTICSDDPRGVVRYRCRRCYCCRRRRCRWQRRRRRRRRRPTNRRAASTR